jgi:hypothetical protein
LDPFISSAKIAICTILKAEQPESTPSSTRHRNGVANLGIPGVMRYQYTSRIPNLINRPHAAVPFSITRYTTIGRKRKLKLTQNLIQKESANGCGSSIRRFSRLVHRIQPAFPANTPTDSFP